MDTPEQTITEETKTYWAYVEIFGHQRTAGRISTRKFGTQEMIQVDVPKGESDFSHSELFNPQAVFSLRPTTEDWCRRFAAHSQPSRELLPYIPEKTPPMIEQSQICDPEDDPKNDPEEYYGDGGRGISR